MFSASNLGSFEDVHKPHDYDADRPFVNLAHSAQAF